MLILYGIFELIIIAFCVIIAVNFACMTVWFVWQMMILIFYFPFMLIKTGSIKKAWEALENVSEDYVGL